MIISMAGVGLRVTVLHRLSLPAPTRISKHDAGSRFACRAGTDLNLLTSSPSASSGSSL